MLFFMKEGCKRLGGLCRAAGVEQLMYIKEDLIIPHVSAAVHRSELL